MGHQITTVVTRFVPVIENHWPDSQPHLCSIEGLMGKLRGGLEGHRSVCQCRDSGMLDRSGL